jgi:hypothetical protein
MRIRCRRNVFTEPLPRNECCFRAVHKKRRSLWLHSSCLSKYATISYLIYLPTQTYIRSMFSVVYLAFTQDLVGNQIPRCTACFTDSPPNTKSKFRPNTAFPMSQFRLNAVCLLTAGKVCFLMPFTTSTLLISLSPRENKLTVATEHLN